MWEAMFSHNQTMEKVLRETLDVLQDQQLRRLPGLITDDNCIRHLAVSYRARPCSSSGPCVCLCPSTPKLAAPPGRTCRRSRQRKAAGCCQARGTRGPCGPPQPQLPQDGLPGPGAPGLSRQESQEPHGACSPAGSGSLSMLCSFQLLARADVGQEDLDAVYHLQRLLKHPSQAMHSLVLHVLLPVSERPAMVSRAHLCEGRCAFVLKVSWPTHGQLGGLCSACSSVAQKKRSRNGGHGGAQRLSGELSMRAGLPTHVPVGAGPKRGHRVFAQLPSFSYPCSPHIRNGCPWPLPVWWLLPGALLVLPLHKQDGSLVLWHHRVLARVAFHCFSKRKLSFIQARRIPVLLPGIMEGLQAAKADTKLKALLLIGNVMGHVKRKQASSIALQVAGEILPLFNDVRLLRDLSPQMGTLMTAAPRDGDLLRSL